MCGICGFTGRNDLKTLKSMMDRLVHRGPDDQGLYSDASVSLGMRRLSIIDIETGKQPVHNEEKSVWVVFNGEIYNYIELRKELEEKGHRFYTHHSDTEVLVHLYEEEGISFLRRLNGMFAIALWDTRSQSLFLVRDRMGVKPLFYACCGKELVFSSEIKALLVHPAVSRQPDFTGIYHYFTFKHVPAPLTAFAGIRALLPGQVLLFRQGNVSFETWWKLKFDTGVALQEEEAIERINHILEDATRLRMRSDAPFGAYLSGGVDSSAVVALMSRFSSRPVKTFSLGYEDSFRNKDADLSFARKVSQRFGTQHHEYIMSSRELACEINNVIQAFDQPFSGTVSTYFLTKLIQKHVKVALSGDAADELFGSYLSHRMARPFFSYASLRKSKTAGQLAQGQPSSFDGFDQEKLEALFQKSKGDEALWRYSLYPLGDQEKNQLLTDEFKGSLGSCSTLELLKEYFGKVTAQDPLDRVLEMEWNTQLPDQVLAFVDFLSMAHSVEIRSPFLDYRLAECAAMIPGGLKIKDGTVKYILKKAVGPLLPEGITARAKEGFVLPVFDWMETSLRGFVEDMLSPARLKRHNFFNESQVRSLCDGFYAGKKEYAARIWNLAMFQVWWSNYFASS